MTNESLLGGYRPMVSPFPREITPHPPTADTLLWIVIVGALLIATVWHGRGRIGRPVALPWPGMAIWEWTMVALVTIAAATGYLVPSYWRFTRYSIASYDIGIYPHAFWNALNGNGLFNSPEGLDHLSCHASPGLYLLLPLYALAPNGFTVLVLNTMALVAGAVPSYLIARRRLGGLASVCCMAVYLTNPALRSLNYDVHEVTFAVPLLLWGLFFLLLQRTRPMLVMLVLAMLFKEDIGLVVSACGLYIGLVQRRLHVGIAVVFLGALWTIVGVGVIVPYFGGNHASGYFDRYRTFGDTWVEILLSPVLRPQVWIETLTSRATLGYLSLLLTPFAFLPLLAPPTLLLAAPSIAVNVLSHDEVMRSFTYHYEALLLPGLYVAFVAGLTAIVALVRGGRSREPKWLVAMLVLAIGGLAVANVRLDQSVGRPLLLDINGDLARDELDTIVALVPPGAPTVSPQNVQPHLSNRPVNAFLNNVDDFSGNHPPFHYAVIPVTAKQPPAEYEVVWKGEVYALFRLRGVAQ